MIPTLLLYVYICLKKILVKFCNQIFFFKGGGVTYMGTVSVHYLIQA